MSIQNVNAPSNNSAHSDFKRFGSLATGIVLEGVFAGGIFGLNKVLNNMHEITENKCQLEKKCLQKHKFDCSLYKKECDDAKNNEFSWSIIGFPVLVMGAFLTAVVTIKVMTKKKNSEQEPLLRAPNIV